MNILRTILGLFTGQAGYTVGTAVSGLAQIAALAAAIAPLGLWLAGNKNEVFITLTYGDLAFWGALIGVQVFLIVRLVHRAPPPQ